MIVVFISFLDVNLPACRAGGMGVADGWGWATNSLSRGVKR